MAQRKLLTSGNAFSRTDGRWGGVVSYESFRDGFILGAWLMIEVACGQSRFSEGD